MIPPARLPGASFHGRVIGAAARTGLFAGVIAAAVSMIAVGTATGPARATTILAPLSYRTWKVTEGASTVRTSQWIVPLRIAQRLSAHVDLDLEGALQGGRDDAPGIAQLSGATDMRTGLLLRLMNDRLQIRTTLGIPTGPRRLDPAQTRLALALAPPFLGYRARETGSGVEGAIATSYAFPLSSRWSMGIGGGYVYQGRFDAVRDVAVVLPGPEYDVSAGIDGRIGAIDLRIDVTHRRYVEDRGGTGYTEPPSWEGSLRASTAGEAWNSGATLLFCDKAPAAHGSTPLSGRYIAGTLESRRRVGRASWLGIGGEATRFTGWGGAITAGPTSWSAGGGPQISVPLGGGLRVETHLHRLFGEMGRTGSSSPGDMAGWDILVSLALSSSPSLP